MLSTISRTCCPGGSASAFHAYDPIDSRPHYNIFGAGHPSTIPLPPSPTPADDDAIGAGRPSKIPLPPSPTPSADSTASVQNIEGPRETAKQTERFPSFVNPAAPLVVAAPRNSVYFFAGGQSTLALPTFSSLSADIEATAPGLLVPDDVGEDKAARIQRQRLLEQNVVLLMRRYVRVVAQRERHKLVAERSRARMKTAALRVRSTEISVQQQRRLIEELEGQNRRLEAKVEELREAYGRKGKCEQSQWESFEAAHQTQPDGETRYVHGAATTTAERVTIMLAYIGSLEEDLRCTIRERRELHRDMVRMQESGDAWREEESESDDTERETDTICHSAFEESAALQARVTILEENLACSNKRCKELQRDNIQLRSNLEVGSTEPMAERAELCHGERSDEAEVLQARIDALQEALTRADKKNSELRWNNVKQNEEKVRLLENYHELSAKERRCRRDRRNTLG